MTDELIGLRKENEDLRAKLRNLISHATGGNMSDTDLPLNAIAVEISRLRTMIWNQAQESARKEDATRIEQLLNALRPFADFADPHGYVPDEHKITVGSSMAKRQLTMADCRKARAALTGEHNG